jgi:hypothetical protein
MLAQKESKAENYSEMNGQQLMLALNVLSDAKDRTNFLTQYLMERTHRPSMASHLGMLLEPFSLPMHRCLL